MALTQKEIADVLGKEFKLSVRESQAVVTRVLPDADFDAAARAFARRLADGPTLAHAATKRLVREQRDAGTRAADALVPEVGGALFGTEDLQRAVASFLEDGPGKATYEGH